MLVRPDPVSIWPIWSRNGLSFWAGRATARVGRVRSRSARRSGRQASPAGPLAVQPGLTRSLRRATAQTPGADFDRSRNESLRPQPQHHRHDRDGRDLVSGVDQPDAQRLVREAVAGQSPRWPRTRATGAGRRRRSCRGCPRSARRSSPAWWPSRTSIRTRSRSSGPCWPASPRCPPVCSRGRPSTPWRTARGEYHRAPRPKVRTVARPTARKFTSERCIGLSLAVLVVHRRYRFRHRAGRGREPAIMSCKLPVRTHGDDLAGCGVPPVRSAGTVPAAHDARQSETDAPFPRSGHRADTARCARRTAVGRRTHGSLDASY